MATKASEYFNRIKRKPRQHDASEQPLRSFVDLYLTDLGAQNKSSKYIVDARQILGAFMGFLAEALEHDPTLAEFTLDAAKAYALYAQERNRSHFNLVRGMVEQTAHPLSSVTVKKHLRQLKVFSSWLASEEWTRDTRGVPESVLGRLELPKADQRELQPLTKEEETKLLRACDDRTMAGCRRLAMVGLFLDSGARLNEIAGLRVQDVDFTAGVIRIQPEHAKGRKGRTVSFGKKVERALMRYAVVFRDPPISRALPDDPFFLSPDGEPVTGNGIYQMFRRMAKRTGIERLHPHLMRHSSATHDIERGKSTREVQVKLGHASVITTERYTHIVDRERSNRKRDSHVDDLPVNVRRGSKR